VSRVNKVISREYVHKIAVQPKQKNDNITITVSNVVDDYINSANEIKNDKILSSLFSWRKKSVIFYELDPKIPVSAFKTTFFSYANKKLEQKLNGRHLEISIDTIPNIFSVNPEGSSFGALFGEDVISIQSCACVKNMVVSYRVIPASDTTTMKKGIITIADTNRKVSIKFLRSIESGMLEYFDQYDLSIAAISKRIIDRLIIEL
jgi:hypothetical protein